MDEFKKKKEKKEKLFLVNSDHSTIVTVNKVENDEYCSFLLKFVEDSTDNLKIQMDISNFEVILNSLQLHFIVNFVVHFIVDFIPTSSIKLNLKALIYLPLLLISISLSQTRKNY